jgi:protein SCO1/2
MRRISVALMALLFAAAARGQTYGRPTILVGAGIDQRMGAPIPLDTAFSDEQGRPVTLRQYFGKPVILALVYYQCPSLCNMVLTGIVRSTRQLSLNAGQDFDIVAVSFDPRETSALAAAKKETYLKEYGRPGSNNGWHFLTGTDTSINALTQAVGFHYNYDAKTNQFAHPSAIMILTPDGRLARYFYGIDYPSRDVRLGLVEASGGRIGSPIDEVLLYCYHYDASNGKYGLVIMNVIRAGGILTLGALLSFILITLRRERHSAQHLSGARG